MKEIVLLLFFREEEYGRRLLRFLTKKKNKQIRLELMTNRQRVMWRTQTTSQRLVVLTDDEGLYEEEEKEVILLGDDSNREQKRILQYQRAEGIYVELMKILGCDKECEKIEKGILMFFSPEGCSVTEMAVMVSQYLGRMGKCLFLSLSGFPAYFDGEFCEKPHWPERDLSELLLCSTKEMFLTKLSECVHSFGCAKMVTPFAHYKDLLDCRMEDLKELLERLRTVGGYGSIVVELGALSEALMDFMSCADRLFIVCKKDAFGRVRENVFRHYLEMEKKESLMTHAEFIPEWDEMSQWRKGLASLPLTEWSENNQLMAQVGKLIEEEGGADDVCTWEDME